MQDLFPGNVSTSLDLSGFEPCPKRSNNEHCKEAQEVQVQTSATDRNCLEQKYGTHFTELMRLPYFDCVWLHIIDPMHNLFTGTAKHGLKNIWMDPDKPLLENNNLLKIQEKVDKIPVPADVGRIPKKIQNSYGGFTADQWKSFTIFFSVYALHGILPATDLEIWQDFVMACTFLNSAETLNSIMSKQDHPKYASTHPSAWL